MIAEHYITLDDLAALLAERGFVPAASAGNQRWFVHRRSGDEIGIPVTATERLVAVTVGTVRSHLDQYGLMERDEFDEWMWRLALARNDTANGTKGGKVTRANGEPNGANRNRGTLQKNARRASGHKTQRAQR